MFRTSVHGFFADLSRAYNMVRVFEGKIIQKWTEGKQELLRVSGRYELSRVRVTEGKITVKVRRKSRGNRHWFELARVRVIGNQLQSYSANWHTKHGIFEATSCSFATTYTTPKILRRCEDVKKLIKWEHQLLSTKWNTGLPLSVVIHVVIHPFKIPPATQTYSCINVCTPGAHRHRSGGRLRRKVSGMLVVSLRGKNCRFWSHLGLGQTSNLSRT